MVINNKTVFIVLGVTSVAGVLFFTVQKLTGGGTPISQALPDALKIVASDFGTAFPAILTGLAVGGLVLVAFGAGVLTGPAAVLALAAVGIATFATSYYAVKNIAEQQAANTTELSTGN